MTAANGDGGFLLIFLISTILIGFPLLLAEFALGRSAGVSAIKTFGKLGKNNKYNFIGWIGAFALFILLSFYSVIGGWILVYLGIEFGKLFQLGGTGDYAQLFTSIISNPAIALGAQAAFILLNIFIVSRGVQKGIERASKVMMPLLFIIFVVIIGRSLSLPNAMEGVLYFLKPDFSKLTSAGLLYALGQSFFALSLGVTVMLTYASYLDKKTNLVQSGISIVAMNISISIMAGLAIFQARSPFNIQSEGGPSLLFIVLPQLFDKMPFGTIFYVLFLLLFLFAPVTFSVVMLEINVGNITNQDNSKRAKWSVILGILTFVFGIPSALSYGVMAVFTSLVRLSLMPWISWFPIFSCHLELSAFHFLQAISLKRLLLWRNSISMKEPGNKYFSKSGSSSFVSSFRHSNHHRGLHRPIYVIKKDLSSELRPFLFMDD
ncbi:sodium-dependent transporter [Streptococcus pneumoniae]|uniref:sodium-dependent transporter n=1 Tax=Streptococcus pneumoniae TaxID=1313 RepID=UPI000B710E31|nr:sodium-dependent transporter [Streptococcus pneumoniae]SNM69911.1 sodium-dependent transporter [Streptococcus pneumoniae]